MLVMKDPQKGTEVTNYRPIACLAMMWKLLTGMIAEKMYVHLAQNGLLVDEQEGCRKASRGTKDQLLIDKAILKKCRRLLTNLSMAWIDFRKTYDIVPHSWILKCMKMLGLARNMVTIMRNSMVNWKTVLTYRGNDLGEVKIKRGIFQGESLTPLLFVIIMLPLTLILCKRSAGYKIYKEMKVINPLLFMDDLKIYAASKDELDSLTQSVRLDKCAVLEMKRGRKKHSSGVELRSGASMREVEDVWYKYLGILQQDQTLNAKMKAKTGEEYIRWVNTLCRSKLNGGNLVLGINSWAVAVVRYGAGSWSGLKKSLQTWIGKHRRLCP